MLRNLGPPKGILPEPTRTMISVSSQYCDIYIYYDPHYDDSQFGMGSSCWLAGCNAPCPNTESFYSSFHTADFGIRLFPIWAPTVLYSKATARTHHIARVWTTPKGVGS